MKSTTHFLIALIVLMIIIYEYSANFEIITHPYMMVLMTTLYGIFGWHFGIGIGKIINK